jgi:DeoR/GlpR family transcriptional regulator of sugar metabolism
MDIPDKRRIEIKKLVTENESITVSNMAKLFNVSEITIRRDLEKLEDEGFLDKVHGGAIIKGLRTEYDPVYLEDLKINREQKQRISKEAVKIIKNGDAIIIEAGTTCLEIVYNLEDKRNLAIFTASVPTAYELWKIALNRNDIEVNISGGLIETRSSSLIGNQVTQFFENINADIAFMSAVAISTEKGVMTTNSQMDADVTRAIAKSAARKILLVDSSKFEKSGYISALPLNIFDEIITDSSISGKYARELKNFGVKIKIV